MVQLVQRGHRHDDPGRHPEHPRLVTADDGRLELV
jgi:hypothetical protein